MRLTRDAIYNQYLRNIGKVGTTESSITADFNLNLGQRYQLILATLKDYQTQQPYSTTTIASQQYYPYPAGHIMNDDVVVTIGSVQYPLTTIYSQHQWDVLNAIQIQPTAIPQFIFPRRDDFGIWPIPRDAYPLTYYYFLRDRNLTIADYAVGTVSLIAGSATVTGSGTTFTPAMVGRWFTVTDATAPGQGYWYRISAYTSATSITLSRVYTGSTASGVTYNIGESPEIPEEGHIILVDGVTADFYAGLRNDNTSATWYNNKFWTGDGNNPSRDMGSDKITGGLIGLATRYSGRDDKRIIKRQPNIFPPSYKIWASSIS